MRMQVSQQGCLLVTHPMAVFVDIAMSQLCTRGLQTTLQYMYKLVGPAVLAADTLRVCPMALQAWGLPTL